MLIVSLLSHVSDSHRAFPISDGAGADKGCNLFGTPGGELVKAIVEGIRGQLISTDRGQLFEEPLEGFEEVGKHHPPQLPQVPVVHRRIHRLRIDVVIDVPH